MSHAFAIVLVKPCDDLRAEVSRLMEPFDESNEPPHEDENEFDPNHWWDWWKVGGRWDGVIRRLERIDDGEGGFNFGERFATIERNAIPVIEMGECRPFTLVTPEGEFSHRVHFVSAPHKTGWPWEYVDNDSFDRWCIEQLLAHRDCIAVGVDYHS